MISEKHFQNLHTRLPSEKLNQSQFFKAVKAGKENNMTFEKLFKRLRRAGLNCAVAESYLSEMRNGEDVNNNYNFLYGWLYGLDTAGLITDDEHGILINILNQTAGDEE